MAERGYGTSSEYVRELIRKDQDRQHLRGRLLAGASSQPAQTADSAYFDALRDRVALGFVDALEKAYAYIGSHMPH